MPDETGIDLAVGATVEAAAAAALMDQGKSGIKNAALEGHCSNCNTKLLGRHCYNCGQVADTFHRPVWALFAEVLEGYLGLDGRLWRTIPPLLLNPGKITAQYLSGVRQPYMTPFRLFLLSSLLFFLVFTLATSGNNSVIPQDVVDIVEESSAESLDEARGVLETVKDDLEEADTPGAGFAQAGIEALDGEISRTQALAAAEPSKFSATQRGICVLRATVIPEDPPTELCQDIADEKAEREGSEGGANARGQAVDGQPQTTDDGTVIIPIGSANGDGNQSISFDTNRMEETFSADTRRFLVGNVETAINDPDQYKATLGRWAPRLVFVLAPAYGLLLALMFFWRRDIFIYDHMVVALHFHAFLFLFLVLLFPLGGLIGPVFPGIAFALWSNYYLYRMLRRVYSSNRFTAILRVFILDSVYFLLLTLAFALLLLLGVVFV